MEKGKQAQQFHHLAPEATLAMVHSSEQTGLSSQTAAQRLEQDGSNQLDQGKTKSIVARFADQFKDFMILVLLVAAVVSGIVAHEWSDAALILAVVVVNALLGVFQELKAEEAINALQDMTTPEANVRRDGHVTKVSSHDLVVGDIVLLEAGDIVPADLRLLTSSSLKIEEAALTGESVPSEKDSTVIISEDAPVGDRTNMAYMNSSVTYGRAEGVVVATGMQTQVGQIAGMLNTATELKTPLQENLNRLGKTITWLIIAIAVIIFVVGLWNNPHNLPLPEVTVEMLLVAISLAVAAIPEGLPAIVTIILALGTTKMAKRQALVRRLPAVETLGSTDIVASDKTGTLTQNKMTVEKYYEYGQLHDAKEPLAAQDHLIRIMTLANDTKIKADGELVGDPTETALIQFGRDQGYDAALQQTQFPRVDEVPFDSDRKLMSTVHQLANHEWLIAVKGAPDELLRRATQLAVSPNQIEPLTDQQRASLAKINHDLAQDALRVLAMAYRIETTRPQVMASDQIEQDLIFVGLVGMIDPERPEAAAAVLDAKAAGIVPLMITGDHQDTAEAIAKRLHIIGPDDHDRVTTGAALNDLTDDELYEQVPQFSVYARVSPEHKVRIVKAWQRHGKVVAMTGDGVNDAPALKNADIGVGMGITGTEVSKSASDMVLADDNFATIIAAVKEGRKVFANIQKAIQYLLSANLGEVLTLFTMTMLSWDILLPIQLLWINLVTDTLPAIALGLEPAEDDIMVRKPRGRQATFLSDGVGSSVIYQGILEGVLTLGVYWLAIKFPVHQSYSAIHADALTMAYITLGLIQLFHAFNVKSLHGSLVNSHPFANRAFNGALVISAVLLAATVLVPGFNTLFHVTALTSSQWATVLGAGVLMIVIVELVKVFQRHQKSE